MGPEFDWVFEDDGLHGGAWYWARGTDEHTPLPLGGCLDTPFGILDYSHSRDGVSWFQDGKARYWGVERGDGEGDDDGLLLMSEAWYYGLSGLTACWGYDPPEDAFIAGGFLERLGGHLDEYSPKCRGGDSRRRRSHLED